MKKEYVKPYLALESFQLVAALAGSCSGSDKIALNQGIHTCDAIDEASDSFFGDKCILNIYVFGDATSDPWCYHEVVDAGAYLTS